MSFSGKSPERVPTSVDRLSLIWTLRPQDLWLPIVFNPWLQGWCGHHHPSQPKGTKTIRKHMWENFIGIPRLGRSHLCSHSAGENSAVWPQIPIRVAGKSSLAATQEIKKGYYCSQRPLLQDIYSTFICREV